jgi:phosphatidylglycerophosphate synthase
MRQHLQTVPNQLTAVRLILLPVTWGLALLRLPIYVGIAIVVSFVVDYLDGYFARRLKQTSDFGSKFDSLVDNLFIPSTLIWLGLLKPEVFQEHTLLWVAAISIYVASLLLGLVKFRRFANLHLKSSRYGSVVMVLFVAQAFIMPHYSLWLFYIAITAYILSSSESLLLQLISARVDAHMGSILFVLQKRNADKSRGPHA